MASLQPYYICIFIVGDFVDNLSLDMYNSIKNNYEKKKEKKKSNSACIYISKSMGQFHFGTKLNFII